MRGGWGGERWGGFGEGRGEQGLADAWIVIVILLLHQCAMVISTISTA